MHAEKLWAHAVKASFTTVDNLSRALAQSTEDTAYKQGIDNLSANDGKLFLFGCYRNPL